ncbi:MAG: MFS transporter [Chloroflexi bacterium]|nr:MFS transporter [Chloroflexota bacterium]
MSPHPSHVVSTEGIPEDKRSDFKAGQVFTMSASHGLHDTYSAFLAPLLPELIQRFSLTNAEAGLLSAFQQFPSIFQPIIGYLADRVSLRYLVILAPGITATAMSLLGIAPHYVLIALLLTVAGFSSAGIHAIGPVMAGRVSGERLGRGMSFWMVGGELGRTLGPILVVSTVAWFGLEGTAWLMPGGWLASILLFFRLRGVSGKPADLPQGPNWKDVLLQMRPFLVALALLHVVQSFSSVALTTYLPIFMREGGASLWWAGVSLSILQAAGVIGAFVGGSLSDRLGRRRTLAIALAVTAVLIVAFLYVPGAWQAWLLPFLGFFSLSTTPVIMAIVQECYPENRAMANGLYMAVSFVIRSIILVVFGGISDAVGMTNAFLLSAVLLLLGLPILRLFPVCRVSQVGN